MHSVQFNNHGASALASSPLPPPPLSPSEQTPCRAGNPPTAVGAALAGPCTLRDGVVVMIRPIHDEDMQRLQAFHLTLSPRTLYLRFGHLLAGFPDQLAAWLTCVDGDQRMAFVATETESENGDGDAITSPTQAIIAVARYEHVRPLVAEVAEVVADRWQGRGLGPQLVIRLAVYAYRRGYTTFIGYMRGTNEHAVHALIHGALPYTLQQLDDDTLLSTADITHAEALWRPSVGSQT